MKAKILSLRISEDTSVMQFTALPKDQFDFFKKNCFGLCMLSGLTTTPKLGELSTDDVATVTAYQEVAEFDIDTLDYDFDGSVQLERVVLGAATLTDFFRGREATADESYGYLITTYTDENRPAHDITIKFRDGNWYLFDPSPYKLEDDQVYLDTPLSRSGELKTPNQQVVSVDAYLLNSYGTDIKTVLHRITQDVPEI